MSRSVIARMKSLVRNRRHSDVLLLLAQKALRDALRIGDADRVEIYSLPTRTAATTDLARHKYKARLLAFSDPQISGFTRRPGEIEARFSAGGRCLALFRDDMMVAWLWFRKATCEDPAYPIRVHFGSASSSCWDYDVYVAPSARLGRAFSVLWHAAIHEMTLLEISHTFSAISRFNDASIRSHERLGAESIGNFVYFRVGTLKVMLSSLLRWGIWIGTTPDSRANILLSRTCTINQTTGAS